MNNVKPTGQEPHAAPRKATYQKPEIEVIHMEQEVIAAAIAVKAIVEAPAPVNWKT